MRGIRLGPTPLAIVGGLKLQRTIIMYALKSTTKSKIKTFRVNSMMDLFSNYS